MAPVHWARPRAGCCARGGGGRGARLLFSHRRSQFSPWHFRPPNVLFYWCSPPVPPTARMSASATLAPCLGFPHARLAPTSGPSPLAVTSPCSAHLPAAHPPAPWLSPSPSSRTGSTLPFSRRQTPSILPTAVPRLHSPPPLSCCAAPFILQDESPANTVHNAMLTRVPSRSVSLPAPPPTV